MIRFTVAMVLLVAAVAADAPGQNPLDDLLSPARLPRLKESRLLQVSSFDTTGDNNDFRAIPDGATAVLADLKGPGVITGIWVTIAAKDPFFLRRILLRMYWDGEPYPSVEAPIGDFFGTGFVYRHYITPLLGMSSGGYYCYFPMPFNRSARVEVVNQTGQEVQSFYYHINYHALTRPLDPDVAYFHAQWRREVRTDPSRNYTVLDAGGRGHLAGVSMSMQSYSRDLQYLEGDEMVYVDGEKFPSIYGTGTEDYFKGGWYFNHGEFAAPYHGLILKDDTLGRIAAYRFHVQDAIPFRSSLRFTIEHGHGNSESADYSSTAYWYQLEPHKPFEDMPPAGFRIPLRVAVPNGAIEAETLAPVPAGSWVESMTEFGAEWSDAKQLRMPLQRQGETISLAIPAEEERYNVSLYYTKGPDYGDLRITHEGRTVGEISGYSRAVVPGGRVLLKDIRNSSGSIPLSFTVTGRDPASTGFHAGFDAFVLEPHREYIPDWYLIGPFPNPRDASLRRLGLDQVYPPEKEFDTTRAYPGEGGKPVRWMYTPTPQRGRVDLYSFDPYEMVVVYAMTHVFSPADQTVPLLLGTDDGVKVFLNGEEIHRVLTIRVARPDMDRIPLSLRKGWNRLLLKIENNYGGYNFYARVPEAVRTLRWSARRSER